MENENKNKRITIRVTDEQFSTLKAVSKIQHISMGEIIRNVLAENPPIIIDGVDTSEYKKSIAQIASLGNLLKKQNDDYIKAIKLMYKTGAIPKEIAQQLLGKNKEVYSELGQSIYDLKMELVKLREQVNGLSKK